MANMVRQARAGSDQTRETSSFVVCERLPFGAWSPRNDLIARLGMGLVCRHVRRCCIQLLSFLGSLGGCGFVMSISTADRTIAFYIV